MRRCSPLQLMFIGMSACGGAQRHASQDTDDFACNERSASYLVKGSLTANEVGVEVDCAEKGPRVHRWTVDKAGTRDEFEGSLSRREFDTLWGKIDATGWRYLKNCEGTGQKGDPAYVFRVHDWNGTGSFRCVTSEALPYPYNTFVDELDFKAAAAAPEDHSKPKPEDVN